VALTHQDSGPSHNHSAYALASLVVAHPDDEVLWASSIAGAVAEVVFCYENCPPLPDLGGARRRAIAKYPLPAVYTLGLTESGSFDKANWLWPRQSECGLAVSKREAAYSASYSALYRLLSQRLASRPIVVTHNPWGEYGHEDHVQVYRVVERLQRELGFSLWVSCYVGVKSKRLMEWTIGAARAVSQPLPTDLALAHRIRDLCIREGCWTWRNDHEWPKCESFLLMAGNSGKVPLATTAPRAALLPATRRRSRAERAVGWMLRRVRQ
jgi:hypothetical protein